MLALFVILMLFLVNCRVTVFGLRVRMLNCLRVGLGLVVRLLVLVVRLW